jgi:hypothetical protein
MANGDTGWSKAGRCQSRSKVAKPHREEASVPGDVDALQEWCCADRTYHEHALEDAVRCQPQNAPIEDLTVGH